MPKLAANLTMLYPEHPFLERFAAAAADGFDAVEFLWPYDHPPEAIAGQLAACGLRNVLFNLPLGDRDAGERGLAGVPGREAEFRAHVELAVRYARALGTPRVHVLAGVAPPSATPMLLARMRHTYVSNLRWAARRLADEGLQATIEPINLRSIPGYLLNRQADALAVLEEVGAPNLKVQFDFFHCQIVEGDVTMRLRASLPHVGHVQVAGVPDRHEPDLGEGNAPVLLAELDRLGYAGTVGCEYVPADPSPGGTSRGLAWARRWLRQAPR